MEIVTLQEMDVPKLFSRHVFTDSRGHFSELFSNETISKYGFSEHMQVNFSQSRKNVVRGLHFQSGIFSQSKLVTCISGEIQDVLLNLNPNNSEPEISYFNLNAERGEILYIPKGFAHGFQSKSENTRIAYLVDSPYSPDNEITINAIDKSLGIVWDEPIIVSEKDSRGINYSEWVKTTKYIRGGLNG